MLKALGDPYFVAKFQRTFGLKEIRREDLVNGLAYGENKDDSCASSNNGIVQNGCAARNHVSNGSTNHVHINGYVKPVPFEKCVEPKEYKQQFEYNSFFHIIFFFGSSLGYEIFYVTFFPFVFWNIDEYLARRTLVLWALIMYIGQASKDVIQWPRPPCPPIICVEKRFVVEYGMPSTHAMVGTLMPFCLVYFTYDRYQYPLYVGLIFGFCWCLLVSTSRLYMGMHTLQDVLAGITFALLLLFTVIPIIDVSVDRWAFTSPNTPIFLVVIPLAMIVLYPSPPKHTETRADTAMIICGAFGALLASWTRYYLQGMPDPYLGTPYAIRLPTLRKIIGMLCKFVSGGALLVPTRLVVKSTVYKVVPWLFAETDPKRKKSLAELPHRVLTYYALGFVAVFVIPQMFAYFGV